MFFAKDAALQEYYCFEMSPAGTVLDYRASFYRKFDHSWECPGLVLSGKYSPRRLRCGGVHPPDNAERNVRGRFSAG